MTKAYSYLRISSEMQKAGDGIRRQIEASEKYARDNGYELVESLEDIGVSAFKGKNAKEGALGQFLAAVKSGKIESGSVLIVESLDRLSRDKVLASFSQFTNILERGITIVSLMDGQVYTKESVNENVGQLFLTMGVMLRANDESETKSKRLKSVWEKKREEIGTKKLTTRAPAWLELSEDRTEFIVKEHAANMLKVIFDLCIEGMGIYTIARYLNADLEKYKPISSASQWNTSYVSKILHNPAVHGLFEPNRKVDGKRIPTGEVIEDYYPVVVTKEKFLLAQNSLKSRKLAAGRKGEGFSNLFTNLAVCGKCGGSMVHRNKGKPPKGGRWLRCTNNIRGSGCSCPAWNYTDFESAFFQFVREVEFSEIFSSSEEVNERQNLQSQIAIQKEELQEIEAKLEGIVDQLENPNLPDVVMDRLIQRSTKYAEEQKGLEASVIALEADLVALDNVRVQDDQKELIAYLEELEGAEQATRERARYRMNAILRRNVEKISIFNGEYVHPADINDCDELSDLLSQEVRDYLGTRGIDTIDGATDFFSTDFGQRMYDKITRKFRVQFKNGVVREVEPFGDFSHAFKTAEAILESMRKG